SGAQAIVARMKKPENEKPMKEPFEGALDLALCHLLRTGEIQAFKIPDGEICYVATEGVERFGSDHPNAIGITADDYERVVRFTFERDGTKPPTWWKWRYRGASHERQSQGLMALERENEDGTNTRT